MGLGSRIAQNILTLVILYGFGYIIYQSVKGNPVLEKFKDKFGRFTGGKKK